MTWDICFLYTASLFWFVWVFHAYYDKDVSTSSCYAVLFLVWALPQYFIFLCGMTTFFGSPLPDDDVLILLSGYLTTSSLYLWCRYRLHRPFLRSFYGLTVLYTLPWWYAAIGYLYPAQTPCLELWWAVTWFAVFTAGLHWTIRYLLR